MREHLTTAHGSKTGKTFHSCEVKRVCVILCAYDSMKGKNIITLQDGV